MLITLFMFTHVLKTQSSALCLHSQSIFFVIQEFYLESANYLKGQISMKDLTASCAQLSSLMNIVMNSLILVYTQSTLEHIQCGRVQHLMWLVALLLALQ